VPRDEVSLASPERIAVVVGVRPEIVKMAPVVHALRRRQVPHVVLHTEQHAQAEMADAFFTALEYAPDARLGRFDAGSTLDRLTTQLRALKATLVLCQGDTTTTMLAALAGMYAGCRIGHLEAGLRSNDRDMLEERHRRAVDHVAHELLTYTDAQAAQLVSEKARGRITVVGNPMVDVLDMLRPRILAATADCPRYPYLYVTLHRKELTDSAARMRMVFDAIADVARALGVGIEFPVHPRTVDCARRAGVTVPFTPRRPVGLVESLALIQRATVVVTDSGGIQEEAALLGTPCVTVRENTERPETVLTGRNAVTGFSRGAILVAIQLGAGLVRQVTPDPLYGPPGVGDRVVDVVTDASVWRG
jgi:UDP-N-acetylglucosamine 2-epimerase